MRLVYVDSNSQSARTLHGEFLDYRGLNWSLTHCDTPQEAIKHLEQDSFQCLLLRTDGNLDEATFALNQLAQTVDCPPILTVTADMTAIDHLQLILEGSDDCLNRSESNGAGIMRRLRMVELRRSVWGSQLETFAEHEDAAEWMATANEAGSTEAQVLDHSMRNKLKVAHVCYGSSLISVTQTPNADTVFIRLDKLEDLITILDERVHSFDAILIEQSVFEEASPSSINKLNRFLPFVPAIVLTMEKSDFAALSY
ncbi:MAG: hypothetical protein ABL921_33860, partial [Pirellula sp.]